MTAISSHMTRPEQDATGAKDFAGGPSCIHMPLSDLSVSGLRTCSLSRVKS